MKNLLLLVLACLLLAVFPLYGQVDTVTILHLNDTHSNLAPIGPRNPSLEGTQGGIARAVTLLGMERIADPNAMLLHAGDFSVGDLFYNKYFGVAELQILASIGCDALTVGNHEFDLTPSTLMTVLDTAFAAGGFPVLCANINLQDAAVAPLKKYIIPYMTRQVGDVKVGVFGLTTPATNLISQPAPAVLDTPFAAAAAMVETLMTQGCHVIVCLSHLGIGLDNMVAENIPGINLIIGGHDHLAFQQAQPVRNPAGDTTWIVQGSSHYLNLGKLRLTIGAGNVRLLDYSLIPVTDAIPEEPSTAAAVSMMIGEIESVYGPMYTAKIADVESYFEEVADSLMFPGSHDTPIGNLVTDAFRLATGTQIAMEVGGSTAQPLYPGPVVAADAFRVVGYGFNTVNGLGYRLVTFELTGGALFAGLEFGLSSIEQDDEFLVQVSGMKYTYDPARPPFGRVTSVEVRGTALDPLAKYSVTANEFVPMFLDILGIPYDNARICGDTTEFSVLAGYIQQMGSLRPGVEGRVSSGEVVPAVSPRPGDAIPKSYELDQNYPNPFNPETRIRFQVPVESDVKLAVYDLLGREVVVLVDTRKTAGVYEVNLDAGALASGVYLYCLTAGTFSSIKKMVLLK